jgi:hypothetical protein
MRTKQTETIENFFSIETRKGYLNIFLFLKKLMRTLEVLLKRL